MKARMTAALLLVLASVYCVAQGGGGGGAAGELVSFSVLKENRRKVATIRVPARYREETETYAEGVRTVLSYPDGSYIIINVGGMTKVPFFDEPVHVVRERRELPRRIVKSGNVRGTGLYWREENAVGVWPPTNIGFTNVPRARLELFEKSLRSFERQVTSRQLSLSGRTRQRK